MIADGNNVRATGPVSLGVIYTPGHDWLSCAIFGSTRGDDVGGMAAQDHLQLGSGSYYFTKVAGEAVLQLRVQVRLGFFDDDRDVESTRREERVLLGLPVRLGGTGVLPRLRLGVPSRRTVRR